MRRLSLSAFFSLLALVACEGKPAADPSSTPATDKAASDTKPASNYKVKIVASEAKAGVPFTTLIEITPGPGFKMNEDFPTRIKLLPGQATPAQPQYGKGEGEITKKFIRYNVGHQAATAGKIELEAVADFSVCNDTSCKLVRGEKLSWQVEVK